MKQRVSDKINFKWLATSLNPYYETNNQFKDALTEDCFIEQTFENWFFGYDSNSGNILQEKFYESLNEEFKKKLVESTNKSSTDLKSIKSPFFNLITGDGGMSNIEKPELQEENSFKLILNETLVALNCLANNGTFVVKIFGFLNCRTVCLIYILTCLFEKLHLFKPISSKEGNGEIYVVCVNYQLNKNIKLVEKITERFDLSKKSSNINELDVILLKKKIIPPNFLNQLIESACMFATHQTNAIERSIYLYEKNDKKFYFKYKKLQTKIDQHFNSLIDLKPIKIVDQVVKNDLIYFKNNYYFTGINRKRLIAYYNTFSYNDLIEEINDKTKKLTKIKQLIKKIYSRPKQELFDDYFNKFHQFNHDLDLELLKSKDFITEPRNFSDSCSDESIMKCLNSKLCSSELIKLLIDYESLNQETIDNLEAQIQSNEKMILDQFKNLIKLKLDKSANNSLKFVHIGKSHLSSIVSKATNDLNLKSELRLNYEELSQTEDSNDSIVFHIIDLLNVSNKKQLNDEHNTANYLVMKLVEIIDQLTFDDFLVISFPSLYTRYTFDLIYLLCKLFKQLAICPIHLRSQSSNEFRSSSIFVFTNMSYDLMKNSEKQNNSHNNEINQTLTKNNFEEERNKVKNLIIKINNFNLNYKNKQILDFIGIHNLLKDQENADFFKLIILTNNLNLIELMKIKMNISLNFDF